MSGDLPQKPPANPGAKPSAAQMSRKQRLAEELRANLKRRKAAARRHKETDGDDGETSSGNHED
ncbi:hypothetical protein RLW55_00870 [Hyphomicrobium sp. B1]|jgi:hypothetical protein|uniref:hypothetical protein n=1 Tax=unclassified Hyphomicrobium TaxID=2619925 RepID=UPI000213DF20|nr:MULTISPECIES: hypothetical protein [unclassified Hyphomicrobium]CCB63891.1 protein of unknown function [Hyphomicrobium sp. MC1]